MGRTFGRRNRWGRSGGAGALTGYFQLRKNSLLFLALFCGGLLFSSVYTVRDCGGSGLILAVVAGQIRSYAVSGGWQVFSGRLMSNLGYIVYLYFAANCLQGRWLVRLVPAFYGLSVGAVVTALLYQHGLGAGWYLLICVLLPRFLQLMLLLIACNQAVRLSQSISSQKPAGEQPFLLFGILTAAFSMAETLVLCRFSGLLTYL